MTLLRCLLERGRQRDGRGSRDVVILIRGSAADADDRAVHARQRDATRHEGERVVSAGLGGVERSPGVTAAASSSAGWAKSSAVIALSASRSPPCIQTRRSRWRPGRLTRCCGE